MLKNVKAFFLGFFTAVVSFVAFLFTGKLFCNRKSDDGAREHITSAETETERTDEYNRQSGKINQELTELTERGEELLRKIREQKLKE